MNSALNYKQIHQPPKSWPADGWHRSHTKIAFFFEKKVVGHAFWCLANWLTSLTYDDSLTLLGSITTQNSCKTLLSS